MAYAYAGVCALLALYVLPLIYEVEAPRLAIAGQPSLSRPFIPAEEHYSTARPGCPGQANARAEAFTKSVRHGDRRRHHAWGLLAVKESPR